MTKKKSVSPPLQRKRSKKSPLLREAGLRATLQSIGGAVISTDARGRVTMMNGMAEQLTGWKELDARGKPLGHVFRILDEQSRTEVENPGAQVLRKGIVISLCNHLLLIARDGSERLIAGSGAPVRNRSGQIVGVVLTFRDHTAQHRAQQVLQETRELSESIIATVREPLLVLDEKLEVVASNRAFCALFGTTPEETIGRKVYDLGNRQWDIPALRTLLEDILPSNSHFDDFEVTHNFEHLGTRTMLLNARRLFRDENRTRLILLAIEDCTDRLKAEREVRERERMFRQLADSTATAIFIYQHERFVYVNRATEVLSGYSKEELFSMRFWDVVHPDHRELVRQRGLARQRGESVPNRYEFKILHKDGTHRWVDFSAGAIDWLGEPAAIGTAFDITEKEHAVSLVRKSEEQHRLLSGLFCSYGYAIGVNPDKSLTREWVIGGFERTTGYTSEEIDALGGWRALIHPEDMPIAEERGRRLLSGEDDVSEFRIVRKDGAVRWLRDRGHPVWDEAEGRVVRILGAAEDITEGRVAQESVRQAEERFRAVWECSADGMRITDEEGTIVAVNDAYCHIAGARREELEGHSFNDVYKSSEEENQAALLRYKERFAKQTVASRMETALELKCGDVVHVELSNVFLRTLGQPLLLSIFRDVTERKNAEKRLAESLTRFQMASRATSSIIWDWDLRTNSLWWNEHFAKVFGYRLEEVEPDVRSKMHRIHPEDRGRVETEIRSAVDSGKEAWSSEYRFLRKDGTYATVADRGIISRDPAGRATCMIGAMEDITEQRQAALEVQRSRDWLNAILDAFRDGIVAEKDEVIVYANRSFARIYGYAEPTELIGKHVSVVQSEPERMRLLEYGRRRLAGEPAPATYEFEGKRRDGKSIHLEVSASTASIAGDRYIIATVRDVTERKQLQQQLIEAQKMESLGTLAGGIAHDFNNILGIIMGHSSILEQSREDPEKFSRSAQAISKATFRGAALVRQLLTFARKTELTMQPVSINETLSELAKLLGETFPKTIDIRLRLEPRLPLLQADATQLHQVFLNLCVNARDAMVPKGGTLSLTSRLAGGKEVRANFPAAEEMDYVVVDVADTGVGMDQATLSRIFEPLFTTKEKGKGTGLGLATVHGIVESHRGFIGVESAVGSGSTFHVYLPIIGRTPTHESGQKPTDEHLPSGAETILLVEDEETLSDLLKFVLEGKGYKVLRARDGEEALTLFREHSQEISLILSDLGLPKMSGWELFKEIRRLNPNAKVILASGYFEPGTKSELLKSGAEALMQKPYEPAEVLKTVRKVLNGTV